MIKKSNVLQITIEIFDEPKEENNLENWFKTKLKSYLKGKYGSSISTIKHTSKINTPLLEEIIESYTDYNSSIKRIETRYRSLSELQLLVVKFKKAYES